MKTKLLSFAFAMLTVCTSWSQDTIVDAARPNRFPKPVRSYPPLDTTDHRHVCFPFWMVREIALDLEEKELLEQEVALFVLEAEQYQTLLQALERKDQSRVLQLQLLERNTFLLQEQLRVEKLSEKGTRPLIWALRILAALGAGFLFGRL